MSINQEFNSEEGIGTILSDNKAVSPVIGVVLMVAITVVMAAVIGSFVFKLGTPETTPQLSMKLNGIVLNTTSGGNAYDGTSRNTITIVHTGGDALDLSRVTLVMRHEDGTAVNIVKADPINATAGTIFGPGDMMVFAVDGNLAVYMNAVDDDIGNAGATGGSWVMKTGDEITATFFDKDSSSIISELRTIA